MSKEFNTALEASNIVTGLRKQLNRLPYNADLHKLLNNINEMNKELSRLEVEMRQTRKSYKFDAHKEDMVKAIKHLEHLILMATLMS